MEVNLIVETLKFLVLGMSTVFLFLILMVVVLNIQAKIITKFFPSQELPAVSSVVAGNHYRQDKFAILAVIAASLQSYKKSKQ